MDIVLIGFWALVGLSAVAYTPNPDPPDPPPEGPFPPRPCLVCGLVLGVVAGELGGWGFGRAFHAQDLDLKSGLYAATTAVGAFVTARFATNIYRLVSNR